MMGIIGLNGRRAGEVDERVVFARNLDSLFKRQPLAPIGGGVTVGAERPSEDAGVLDGVGQSDPRGEHLRRRKGSEGDRRCGFAHRSSSSVPVSSSHWKVSPAVSSVKPICNICATVLDGVGSQAWTHHSTLKPPLRLLSERGCWRTLYHSLRSLHSRVSGVRRSIGGSMARLDREPWRVRSSSG
uniref:Uncharacterized protein n=1 Tax=uncultured marine virus TaxID=186617 RepID=A0A0F7L9Y9_9VIRU|nr:hypothetical protein [uncultured marine virus]